MHKRQILSDIIGTALNSFCDKDCIRMGGLSMSVYYCVTSIEAHSRVKLSNCTKCLMSTQHAVNPDWFQILQSYTLIM